MTAIDGRTVTRRLAAERAIADERGTSSAVLAGDPGRWLPLPARRCGVGQWTIPLSAGAARRFVTCRVGPVWRMGTTRWRSIVWEPRREPDDIVAFDRILPVFRGELGVTTDDAGATVRLRGVYAPPVGRLGAVADAVALQHVAQLTVDRFLQQVAHRLERPGAPR